MPQHPVSQSTGLAALLIVMVNSIVGFLTAAGYLNWDTPVQVAFNTMVVAIVNVGVVVVPMLRKAKPQTTPLQDPKDSDGVRLMRPNGKPPLHSPLRSFVPDMQELTSDQLEEQVTLAKQFLGKRPRAAKPR
jgi:hypothetical protein